MESVAYSCQVLGFAHFPYLLAKRRASIGPCPSNFRLTKNKKGTRLLLLLLFAVRTKLELVSVTLCITTIFITLFLLCSQFVASIEYFEST